MALLRPNHTMIFDLDERLATSETRLELKRCYAHIGDPLIRTHAPEGDGAPRNTARIIVSVGQRKYLMSADEGADALWSETVEPSIANMLHKVGANMKAFNRRQRKIGLPEVAFDRLDIVLQGGQLTVGLHPDPTCFISRDLRAQIDLARALVNDGTLDGAVRVDAPAAESYERQCDAARTAWDAAHAPAAESGKAAPEPEPADAQEEHRRELAERALADKDLGTGRFFDEEWLAEDADRKSYENTAVAPVDSDELPPAFHIPEIPEPEQFSFEVDYSLWEVTLQDGGKRLFDSAARAFAA